MTDLFRDLAAGAEPRALNVGLWARRAVIALLAIVAALALTDVFGQRESGSSSAGPGATLALRAPRVVRGGLMFQSRIEVTSTVGIDRPRLVLDRGWMEGMQVNSINPTPQGEAVRGDRVVLSFPTLADGDRMTVWLQFQVDPTNVGRRAYGVELDDGERPLARIHRSISVLP
jgi:hypothetical protein